MAFASIDQDELLRETREQLARVDERARQLATPLSPAQLQWSPPAGGWSIAQVFAHLAASNGSYVDPLRAAIERERGASAPRPPRDWRPSFLGALLIRSLDPSSRRPMPTPRIWRPNSGVHFGTLDLFLESQAVLAELTRRAEGIDLVTARLASPVSRFVRLNVGDAFRVFVVHDWRHMGQIERILDQPGFPRT